MVNRKDALYKNTGLQLKAIREELRMTLDAISQETGISRSYLSDFERGFRLPTSKYLNYLHHRHQVNLNFIFGTEGRKFRPGTDEALDFGKFQEEVDKMLVFMAEMPHALYAVLGFFTEYKLMNKELIDRHRAEKEGVKSKNG